MWIVTSPMGPSEPISPPEGQDRLESWKEIAAYLDRDVRTVQRWEKGEGLPVHRHLHEKQGSVFAFRGELEAWRLGRSLPAAGSEAGEEAAEEETLAPAPMDAGKGAKAGPGWVSLGLAGAVLLGAVLLGPQRSDRRAAPAMPSVAVLPFANLSGDEHQEYLSEGLTEELITRLSRLEGERCRVVALRSLMAYRGTPKRNRQVAAELGVDFLLEGSVRRSGDRVRVAVHLVRGRDEVHVWDESYDRDFKDVLTLQGEVAEAISKGFDLQVNHRPQVQVQARVVHPKAYEAYLKGRYLWNRRTPQDLVQALEQFKKALALDGTFAPAYVGLADCYALLGSAEMGLLPPKEVMPAAKGALHKALLLDEGSAEAHASLAHLMFIYDWDYAGSEREFRRAIELNPGFPTAHQWYALLLTATGRLEEGRAELQRAGRLDPRSPIILTAQAEACYFAREYELSEAYASKALDLDPGFLLALVNRARAWEMQGRHDEAIQLFEKGSALTGRAPALTMFLGYAQARKGDRRAAQAALEELRHPPVVGGHPAYVPAVLLAAVHGGLGERDAMFRQLDRAMEERCEYLIYLGRDPMADEVRGDPRFQAILKTLGLV